MTSNRGINSTFRNLKYLEILSEIKHLQSSSISNEFIIYNDICGTIKDLELWKSPEFYNNIDDASEYTRLPFSSFLNQKLRISSQKFSRYERILELKPDGIGEKLLREYGYDNAVIYLNSTESERQALLEAADEYPWGTKWYYLKYRVLFPPILTSNRRDKRTKKIIKLKEEISKLKIENKNLAYKLKVSEDTVVRLEIENRDLKDALSELDNYIKSYSYTAKKFLNKKKITA